MKSFFHREGHEVHEESINKYIYQPLCPSCSSWFNFHFHPCYLSCEITNSGMGKLR